MRGDPDPKVVAWFERQIDDLAVTAVTVGELLTGVASMPAGRRRDGLSVATEMLIRSHGDRILPYDEEAARELAEVREIRRLAGRPSAQKTA